MKDFILLIPCYNNTEGLVASMNSIHYSYERFEVLIVDDGSSPFIGLQMLENIFPEITFNFVRLEKNQGIAKALNAGLAYLKNRRDYKYIARLDCGDTCHTDRFTEQVNFLDQHPETGLVGTWCSFNDAAAGKRYLYKTQTAHDRIVKEMHFKCSFIHPTVMFRREVLDTVGAYPEQYAHAEDYAFFWLILKKYKTHIIPRDLLTVEWKSANISRMHYKLQCISKNRILRDLSISGGLKWLGIIYNTIKRALGAGMISHIKTNT